jgi:Synergist-CTERM protein sorting domain-containing protein
MMKLKIKKISWLTVFSLMFLMFAAVPASAGCVAVTVEKLTLEEGFIVEPELVELSGGETGESVLIDLLTSKGIRFASYTDSEMGFYLSTIWDPENGNELGMTIENMMAGWMVTVNNVSIDRSAGFYDLSDGDVMRWQYTQDWGADIGVDLNNLGPGTKADKDDLIRKVAEMNAAGEGSGDDYEHALSLLKDLDAAWKDVNAAFAALAGVPGTGDEPGAAAEILTYPVIGKLPGGMEAGTGTRAVTYSELAALMPGLESDISLNADGLFVVAGSAFVNFLSDGDRASINTGSVVPFPGLRMKVGNTGNTALVTLKVKLDAYAGKTFASIAVLKMKSDGSAGKLDMKTSIDDLESGSFIWTSEDGGVIPSSNAVAKGTDYFLSVAVEDGSVYDLDGDEDGSVTDPLALALNADGGGGDGDGDGKTNGGGGGSSSSSSSSGGSGGCDSGFGVLALAVLPAVLRGRGRNG